MILGYTEYKEFIAHTSCNRVQLAKSFFLLFSKVTIYIYLSRDSDRTRHWILADVAALKIIGRIIHHIFQSPLKTDGILCQSPKRYAKCSPVITGSCHLPNNRRDGVVTTDMLFRVDQPYNFLEVCTAIFVACIIIMRDSPNLHSREAPESSISHPFKPLR